MKKPDIVEIRIDTGCNDKGKNIIFNNGIIQYVTKFIVTFKDNTDTSVNVDMVSFDPNETFHKDEIIECAYIKYNEMWG
ncbi:hypothetical protein F485_gp160 [Aeromonas phage CC2]|uniref:Uncharacterized protein n=1 Tax=Aeromonas phage CC2 TaxID=1204516 RepID=I6XL40_9CAUD|nr:hypothetical protein F485_gp160 [Aeromonas phage CC2]AFN39229.1 hypothetical protein CC2_135 [Aeromonas phage CC2]